MISVRPLGSTLTVISLLEALQVLGQRALPMRSTAGNQASITPKKHVNKRGENL